MLGEDLGGFIVSFVDDVANGFIDLMSDFSGEVLGGVGVVSSKEDGGVISLVLDWTKLGHTVHGNHGTSDSRSFLDIVGGTGRNIIEEDFFGSTSSKEAGDLGDEFFLG